MNLQYRAKKFYNFKTAYTGQ